MGFLDKKETKRLLKKLPFYNAPIEKPKIKKVNNVDMLSGLPFYHELSIVKSAKAFKRYARSYSIEIINDKDENIYKRLKLVKQLLKICLEIY